MIPYMTCKLAVTVALLRHCVLYKDTLANYSLALNGHFGFECDGIKIGICCDVKVLIEF